MTSAQVFKVPSTLSEAKEAIQDTIQKMQNHIDNRDKKYMRIYYGLNITTIKGKH